MFLLANKSANHSHHGNYNYEEEKATVSHRLKHGKRVDSVSVTIVLCELVYQNGVTLRVTSDMTLDQLRAMVLLLN